MSKKYDIKQTKQFLRVLEIQLQFLTGYADQVQGFPLRRSSERKNAIKKLQESIMWLEVDLKALNVPEPYIESYNPEDTQVEPTTDGLKL
jgi:hypothetical protein